MSDARSLLRAKKASTAPKVTDPYASYNSAGEIRCTLCAMKVTQWAGHIASKQHRTSIARQKDDEKKRSEKKRPAPKPEIAIVMPSSEKKRKMEPAQPTLPTSSNPSSSASSSSVLPPGFFADPSKAPKLEASPPPEEIPSANLTSTSTAAASVNSSNVDAELDDFLASIASVPVATTVVSKVDKEKAMTDETVKTTYEAEPVRIEEVLEEVEEDAGAIRRRKEQEEKEEILLRLEEEERAQDDAFDRVASLKARHAAIKRRREEAKMSKKAAA